MNPKQKKRSKNYTDAFICNRDNTKSLLEELEIIVCGSNNLTKLLLLPPMLRKLCCNDNPLPEWYFDTSPTNVVGRQKEEILLLYA